MAINAQTQVSKTITAQNTFSDILRVGGLKYLNLSIYSTALSATITLQRRRTGDTDWLDVANYTANVEKLIKSAGQWEYRIGVKTGNFTSATALKVYLSY